MQQVDYNRPRTARHFLRLFFTGFAMGAADIVPGVSGGTMAFILGIYETLIDAIKSFDLTAIRLALGLKFKALFEHIPFGFLIALGLGILAAIVTLSNLLGTALENEPALVFSFFGGLVLASIVAIGVKLKWTVATIISLVIGTVFAYVLVGLNPLQNVDHTPVVLFFSGTVAIMAMILPGISGSFILLILGQYAFVLNAVRTSDIVSIGSLALGCVVGIVLFSRVLSWLLHHYEQITIAALVGFMVGSLRKIWIEATASGATDFATMEILIAIALIVCGFILVSFLDHLQTRRNPVFSVWQRSRTTSEIDPAL
jgi:putative membrane protein